MAASRSRRKSHRKPRAPRRTGSEPKPRTGRAGEVWITRKLGFSASHRYENPRWSARRNREVFGPCFNPHGHGHNYELEVTLRGPIDPETGMVLNLRVVDAVLRREILRRFDHRSINDEVPGFEAVVPTVENLCLRIWDLLEQRFRRLGCLLHRVRLFESADLYGEYFGEVEEPST
jgi:6-pyruvoyltetrahydropterin/6-carboxytetrahydropterin synthase